MTDFEAAVICWLLGAAQSLGLASAWIARVSEGSRYQSVGQSLFLACLTLVAAACIGSFTLGPGHWLACGATLSLMVLTVTCDFRRCGQTAAW